MDKKKDKKAPKSKTLPPRTTCPAAEFDFDFFSSTDSSTDWEVSKWYTSNIVSTSWTIEVFFLLLNFLWDIQLFKYPPFPSPKMI